MYPYRSLPENLAAFCARLRDEHAFRIGPRELQDAARALGVTRLGDERAVRNVLRAVLCGSVEDVAAFDAAFDAFFHPVSGGERPQVAGHPAIDDRARHGEEAERTASAREGVRDTDSDLDATSSEGQVIAPFEIHEEDAEAATAVIRSSYSPLDAEDAAPDLEHPDARWRAAASSFVSALRAGISRRWRPARHGERFDLRRTLRHSLHTGAEAVIPRWQVRPRRRPRVVLLIDGSRSMSAHAEVGLKIAVAIAAATSAIEVFTFSTTLQRVTRDLRRVAAGERRRLEDLHRAWGGGTSIGACLQIFLQRFGERLLGRDSIIIIASDGLDVGAADLLRAAMGRLSRESAGVIWLNPLLETPGYEPTAAGMSAARPFVSTFACVNDPGGLQRLGRIVRVRR